MDKNIKKQLELKASWPEIKNILEKLSQKGFQTALVGGAVRDALLGKTPKDIDLATSAPPEEILKIFPVAKGDWIQYGVVFIPLKTKEQLEITRFRKDSFYKDGRRPSSVSYSSMEEDAQRRDFTINALFYDPLTDTVMDFTGGLKDLQNKYLKAVGSAKERFEEDHLRALRALRLAHQLQFQIEEETNKAIPLFAEKIKNLAKERVLKELVKMFSAGRIGTAVQSLKEYRFFNSVFPYLKGKDETRHLKKPINFWNSDFSFCKEPSFVWTVLALPFFHSDEQSFKLFLKNLPAPSSHIKQSLSYWQALQILTDEYSSLTKKLLALNGKKEPVAELSRFWQDSQRKNSDSLIKTLQEFEKRQSQGFLPAALVTGSDLLQLTSPPPPQEFSSLLKQAYEYQIEYPQAEKSEILKYIIKK